MKAKQRCCRGAARTALALLAVVVTGWVVPADAAGAVGGGRAVAAHSRITGTFPADGAVVDAPPARVTIFLASKPATVEGDPLRVHGPTGARIDAGDVTLSVIDHGDTALSVGLPPEATRSAGDYHVAFRVISRDSHLVAGRFSFRTRRPSGAGPESGPESGSESGSGSGSGGPAGVASYSPPTEPERSSYGRPSERAWPKAVFAGGVALGAVGIVTRRWRRSKQEAALRRRALAGVHSWAE
jgi:methionine-rich copper-binding protein CopC